MQYCIPDELFNRIHYPDGSYVEVGLDAIYNEIAYKLPGAEEVVVKREAWHSMCDFCTRLGALVKRKAGVAGATDVDLSEQNMKFLRVVGAKNAGAPTTRFSVQMVEGSGDANDFVPHANFEDAPSGSDICEAFVSYTPMFCDESQTAGVWTPKVPRYMIERYGECVAHGALTRLYAMRGEGQMARMHATAYNNDLNRLSFGLITSGMRKHLLIDIEDWLVSTGGTAANGNG